MRIVEPADDGLRGVLQRRLERKARRRTLELPAGAELVHRFRLPLEDLEVGFARGELQDAARQLVIVNAGALA